jgi:hypothetical protein
MIRSKHLFVHKRLKDQDYIKNHNLIMVTKKVRLRKRL